MEDGNWVVTTVHLDRSTARWLDDLLPSSSSVPPDAETLRKPSEADTGPSWATKETLTVHEVAAILGWKRSKTYAALRSATIPSRRNGERGFLITTREFLRWLEGSTK